MANAEIGRADEKTMGTEDGDSGVGSSPLENSLIVRRILRFFNAQELLQLSAVNKFWNYEARCLLRDERICVAFIKGSQPCLAAKSLNDQLKSMKVIPYNALSVIIDWDDHDCAEWKVDDIYGNLLELPLKELSFRWSGGKECPCGQLILRLLTSAPALERVDVKAMPSKVKLTDLNRAPDAGLFGLPKLKNLSLPDEDHVIKSQVVQDLLSSRAPNLQVLESSLDPPSLKFIPAEKFGIVKSMYFSTHLRLDNEPMLVILKKFCESKPQLQRLSLSKPIQSLQDEQQRSYLAVVAHLLYSSSGTLENLTTDLFWIKILTDLGRRGGICLPQLEKVSTVHFELFQGENAGIGDILLPCPLECIFPAVTKVSFSIGPFSFNIPATQRNVQLPWLAVTEVCLNEERNFFPMSETTARDLGLLFPSLKSLKVAASVEYPKRTPLRLLWGTWPLLERLEITGQYEIQWDNNLDAAFCGIHPEEAELLREMDDEFLEKVNIVSPFPAINHLRGLRELKMKIETSTVNPPTNVAVPNESLFVSKVTHLVAFKQLKDFKLELTTPAEASAYLQHNMKPPVELKFLPPNPERHIHIDDFHSACLNMEWGFVQQFMSQMSANFVDNDAAADDDEEDDSEYHANYLWDPFN